MTKGYARFLNEIISGESGGEDREALAERIRGFSSN